MNGTPSTIVNRMLQYTSDIESFVSGPLKFLKKKQEDEPDIVLNALLFLTISAVLAALLEVHPDSPKPQNLWQLAWESFRAHVFPSLLFAYMQACSVSLLGRVPWRSIFAIYAYSLGVLVVVRSITATIVWDSIGALGPVQDSIDSIISGVFLLVLTVMVLWGRNHSFRLSLFIIPSTVLIGYIVGMFEIAIREPSRKTGFFEPVVLASRLITPVRDQSSEPLSLVFGVNYGTLDRRDVSNDGKYEDIWTLNLTAASNVEVVVSSRQFDSYVRIEGNGGREIDINDDDPRGDTLDSRIDLDLPEGEYRVIVTSYESNGTGEYIVILNSASATVGPAD